MRAWPGQGSLYSASIVARSGHCCATIRSERSVRCERHGRQVVTYAAVLGPKEPHPGPVPRRRRPTAAGLLLLEADFDPSRYAWNDAHRSTPLELGWGWMFRDLKGDDRSFIGRRALEREMAEKTSRWAMRGLVVDWRDYDRVYDEAGLIPPKDHTPVVEDWMVYDDVNQRQVGYATSFMYSPVLQRHIAIARVRPDLATPGTRVKLEFTVDHHYEQVAARVALLPLYNPDRKTA
jgi:aminomethyltransferase